MGQPAKSPVFETVTYRAKKKKRFAVVTDVELIELMKKVGTRLNDAPRLLGEAGGTLVGIYALPTNNVLEIYASLPGQEVGYLFTSLDVWANFARSIDYG